eukprot:CAMPEP_0185183918 /NCGR_PEP_ID=MMETSP1140-20130426/2262_1 /TAXON_ID=298111 /ORGANISM="Pavlova sp., Strain CCMP459" /LENGTH=108 /DNA_ID=CAMNT_0027749953 /DNA_START=167 /DNA_END=493 /DNA_ORIENTATION=+
MCRRRTTIRLLVPQPRRRPTAARARLLGGARTAGRGAAASTRRGPPAPGGPVHSVKLLAGCGGRPSNAALCHRTCGGGARTMKTKTNNASPNSGRDASACFLERATEA